MGFQCFGLLLWLRVHLQFRTVGLDNDLPKLSKFHLQLFQNFTIVKNKPKGFLKFDTLSNFTLNANT